MGRKWGLVYGPLGSESDPVSGPRFWTPFLFAELLARLYAMGIEPIGALGQLATLVEQRVWDPKAA